MSALHIAFHKSIALTLKQALRLQGLTDPVVGLIDDLSFGPVGVAPQSRAAWVAEVVGYDWDDVVTEAEAFWREIEVSPQPLVAWVSFSDSLEYCGFLECLWRIGDRPVEMIDATGVQCVDRAGRIWTPRTLAIVPAEQFVSADYLSRRRPVSRDEIEAHRKLWRRLRAENAPLRIVTPSGLVSAGIDYFDGDLLKHASAEWLKGARLVAETLDGIWRKPDGHHVGDLWLWGRVCALADRGALEIDGDDIAMQTARVRLTPR